MMNKKVREARWVESQRTIRKYVRQRTPRFGALLLLLAGCGNNVPPAPLFLAPLSIEGTPIGHAIIDTGGGYELMLRESYGLTIIHEADVLAFTGRQRVGVTNGFSFEAGGVEGIANAAIVTSSICNCNGIGYLFFRKTAIVLGLDFAGLVASFETSLPPGGVPIRFTAPPTGIPHFDSAFIEVDVSDGNVTRSMLALLDTGTTGTVLRRGIVDAVSALTPNRARITISRAELGGVSLLATLFDTEGLPDLIIGTDVMQTWADRWYFSFDRTGGQVTVFPNATTTDPTDALVNAELAPIASFKRRVGALDVQP